MKYQTIIVLLCCFNSLFYKTRADYVNAYYSTETETCTGEVVQILSVLAGACTSNSIVECDYPNNQLVTTVYNDDECTSYAYSYNTAINECVALSTRNCTTDIPQPINTYTVMTFSDDCSQQKYPLSVATYPLDLCYQIAQPDFEFYYNSCNSTYLTLNQYDDYASIGSSSGSSPICYENQYLSSIQYIHVTDNTQCQPSEILYTCNQ
ncbi:Pol protein [Tieghemostelium lacteum]|uniref:Pol protein n=1 Tax=Tieghemostelium lacteum TaxID=361077 RepID=A0A151Z353_TIELA|nr:Pol protein [Tieghemostelium lacteum]|eukprot:KYQ88393.1 Pol protein [Tieghemostelium lacteum]